MEREGTGRFQQGKKEEIWIEEVKDVAVEEDALQTSTCPPWKNPRPPWQAGKVSWWYADAREESNEERQNRARSWKGDWRRNDWSKQDRTRGGWTFSLRAEVQALVMGAREARLLTVA